MENNSLDLAALYGRVSTDFQDGSLETQLAAGRRFANNNNLTIPDELIFLDEDQSGSLPLTERQQGKLMMNTIKLYGGRIKHLVVPKLDRLGRSLQDLLAQIKELERMEVTVHFCNLPLPADSMGKALRTMFLQILGAFAEFERNMILERINDRMAQKRSKNEVCGTVPYGKNAVGTGEFKARKSGKQVEIRVLEDNLEEQRWLRQMDAWRKAGWSFKKIAAQLNALNVPTKIPKGTPVCVGKDPVTKERIIKPHSGQWQAGNVANVLASSYTKELLSAANPERKAA